MAFCKLLTVLVLIHNTGDLLGAEVRSSIVGGGNAPQGRWPWMAHINMTAGEGSSAKKWRCGGTIVGDQWVLTSASCWNRERNVNLYRSMIWVGSYSLQQGADRYLGVVYAITPRDFDAVGRGYVNDITLVKLKKKIKFTQNVAKVSLTDATDSFNSMSECWITGWGNIRTGVPLPDPETLREVKIPIIPQDVCKATYPDMTDSMMCAGDMAGRVGGCDGDYGGPLMCRASRGYVQVGIMSYGSPDGCGLPGQPGVYTKVFNFLQYIADTIKYNGDTLAED